MSENVEVFETGQSSGSSTPRHGASPSPAQDLQWYEYDLQLAAELGKALLERNQDLETQLAEAEDSMQTQQTEIQFLVQKLESAKNLNETRMRVFEQVDNNAQDLEAANRQLRNQIAVDQQTINRMTHSLKEAESRSEKLENDIYDMKRELAEETKRFRDKWRDAKKKERRTSDESMESDVDADDFILLGDVIRGDVARSNASRDDKRLRASFGSRSSDVDHDAEGGDASEDVCQMADSLQWYQAETEKLTKQLLAVEKKLTTLSAEYRSDICLKMEENKSLTMMLEMMRSKQLSRVCAVSNDEDGEPAAPESHVNKAEPASSSSRPLDSPAPDGASLNGSQMSQSPSPLPAVEVGWSGERRQFGIESGTPTTPTPTSSSCCSSGKVTRNVSFGEVTSLASVTDAPPPDDDDELSRRQSDEVPEVVRRSIEGKAAQRRLSDVAVSGKKIRHSSAEPREDGAAAAAATSTHCRNCGAELHDLCTDCNAKRISLDFEVDDGVVRAIDELPLRASYRVARLRDGACAYGSQNTLDRIGGADIHGSRRGSVSLMSEIGAQYYRLVEKYESLLLRRAESSLGQLTETEEGESDDGESESVYFAETDAEKSLETGNAAGNEALSFKDAVEAPPTDEIQMVSTLSRSAPKQMKHAKNTDVTVCGACQTLDFFADVSFHNVFFCAIFVYSLPKFALMGLSFVLTLILHSRAFKRLFSRVRSNDGKGQSLPPSSGIVMTKKSKKYKKKNEISPSSSPFFIPEWSQGGTTLDRDGGCSGGVVTSTPRRRSSATSFLSNATNLSKPRDLRLATPLSSKPDDMPGVTDSIADDKGTSRERTANLGGEQCQSLRPAFDGASTPPSLMDQPESIPLAPSEERTSSLPPNAHCNSVHTHEYASASPSPSKLIANECLPSSQSESNILHTAPVSRLVQSSTMFKPTTAAEWCGISRSVQTELTSPVEDTLRQIQECSSLRSDVVLRKRRGRAQRGGRPFDGNRTSMAALASSSARCAPESGRSRKCRSLILDEMLERSVLVDKRLDSFSGFDRSPPEYRELFKEIFATLKRTVDREMGRPPTPPMASSV